MVHEAYVSQEGTPIVFTTGVANDSSLTGVVATSKVFLGAVGAVANTWAAPSVRVTTISSPWPFGQFTASTSQRWRLYTSCSIRGASVIFAAAASSVGAIVTDTVELLPPVYRHCVRVGAVSSVVDFVGVSPMIVGPMTALTRRLWTLVSDYAYTADRKGPSIDSRREVDSLRKGVRATH